jgi:hypothetical protein
VEDDGMTLRNFLIQVARRKGMTTYSKAGAIIRLDMGIEIDRIHIAHILNNINNDEDSRGAPMISALVLI